MSSLRTLRLLRLGGVTISDEGLAEVAELNTLDELSLPNGISDTGTLKLVRMRNLKLLELRAVALGDATVKQLRRALPNTTIYHWNPLRDP